MRNIETEVHQEKGFFIKNSHQLSFSSSLQINELNLKVQDLGGKFKKPALRKVRVSADEMLKALFGSKNKGSMDLRANLKSVKKEDIKQEKVRLLGQTERCPESLKEKPDGLFCVSGAEPGGG